MKMRKQDYERLEKAVKRVLKSSPKLSVDNYISAGLTAQRYRWDILHAAKRAGLFDVCDVYHYLSDEHVDTALRKITGTK